jgi:hypothetical protein
MYYSIGFIVLLKCVFGYCGHCNQQTEKQEGVKLTTKYPVPGNPGWTPDSWMQVHVNVDVTEGPAADILKQVLTPLPRVTPRVACMHLFVCI